MSDWKAGAAARRDARATKTPEEAPKVKGGKKSTKRWCRGKVGVEHKPVCRDYRTVKGFATGLWGNAFAEWKLLLCESCGKELETWMPRSWGKPKPKPDWVK